MKSLSDKVQTVNLLVLLGAIFPDPEDKPVFLPAIHHIVAEVAASHTSSTATKLYLQAVADHIGNQKRLGPTPTAAPALVPDDDTPEGQ